VPAREQNAPPATIEQELAALEAGEVDPACFPHLEHVRLGFEMLRRRPFAEAAARFGKGLRIVTARAGKPEIYSETITVAFLALIGERMSRDGAENWEQFIRANRDLADKNILQRWYDAEELQSHAARQRFVLPRRAFR